VDLGALVGASSFYVVISQLPGSRELSKARKALYIGKAKTFDELEDLMERWNVRACQISTQPEPHLVQACRKQSHHGYVNTVELLNDGVSKPDWPKWQRRVTVDRTFLLNSAYDEIREQKWWTPRDAHLIDNGEFYAQLKAPSRVWDLTSGELRYRWTETGALDHYRFAHAFDHLYGAFRKRLGWWASFDGQAGLGRDRAGKVACREEMVRQQFRGERSRIAGVKPAVSRKLLFCNKLLD
jgi:hypothetical protein